MNLVPNRFSISCILMAAMAFLVDCQCRNNDEVTFKPPTRQSPEVPYYVKRYFSEPADNPTTQEGIALGRALFFEKQLSLDGSVSCASCHKPEYAFSDQVKVHQGIGGQTGKRNAPSLYNIGLFKRFFWDGRDTSLEQQSLHPIADPTEMGLSLVEAESRIQAIPKYPELFGKAFGTKQVSSMLIAKALAQFERSLVSYNSKYDRYLQGTYTPTAEEQLGIDLFFQHPISVGPVSSRRRGGNCGDCHLPQSLIGNQEGFDGFHNNGLETSFGSNSDIGLEKVTGKIADRGRFKTPNLRNIALTPPYMHDGRFATLEEVVDHYNKEGLFAHPNVDPLIPAGTNLPGGTSLGITAEEKKAIITFLHMLTDTSASRPF